MIEVLALTCPALLLAVGGFFLSTRSNAPQANVVKPPAPKLTPTVGGSYLSIKQMKFRKTTVGEKKEHGPGADTKMEVTLWYSGPLPTNGKAVIFQVGGKTGLGPCLVDSNGKKYIHDISIIVPGIPIDEQKRRYTYEYFFCLWHVPYKAGQVKFKHQVSADYSKEIPISVIVRKDQSR